MCTYAAYMLPKLLHHFPVRLWQNTRQKQLREEGCLWVYSFRGVQTHHGRGGTVVVAALFGAVCVGLWGWHIRRPSGRTVAGPGSTPQSPADSGLCLLCGDLDPKVSQPWKKCHQLGSKCSGMWICRGYFDPSHNKYKLFVEILPTFHFLSGLVVLKPVCSNWEAPNQCLSKRLHISTAQYQIHSVHWHYRPIFKERSTNTLVFSAVTKHVFMEYKVIF